MKNATYWLHFAMAAIAGYFAGAPLKAAAPVVTLTSPTTQTVMLGTQLTLSSEADDDGNMTEHNIDIQRPPPDNSWNWQGWGREMPYQGIEGDEYHSSKTFTFTFDRAGAWKVGAAALDSEAGAVWQHSAEITITVAIASTVTLTSPSSQTIGRGMSLTVTSNSTDGGLRTGHRLRYQRPGGNWTTLGDESSANGKSQSLTFDQTGTWLIRAEVQDNNSSSWTSSSEATVEVEPTAWINSVQGINIHGVTQPAQGTAADEFKFSPGTQVTLMGWVYAGWQIAVSEGGNHLAFGQLSGNGTKLNWSATIQLPVGVHGLTVNAFQATAEPAAYDYAGGGSYVYSNTDALAVEWKYPPSTVTLTAPSSQTIGRSMSLSITSSSTNGGLRTGHRLRYKSPSGYWQTLGSESSADSKNESLTFNEVGSWLICAEVQDSYSTWVPSSQVTVEVEPTAWIDSVQGININTLPININTVTQPPTGTVADVFKYPSGTSVRLAGWVYPGWQIAVNEGGVLVYGTVSGSGTKRNWTATVQLSVGVHSLTVNAFNSVAEPAAYDYLGGGGYVFSNTDRLAVEWTAFPSTVSLTAPATQTIARSTTLTVSSTSVNGGHRTGHRLVYQSPQSSTWTTLGNANSEDGKSEQLQFTANGEWHIRAEVQDDYGTWRPSDNSATITVNLVSWINSANDAAATTDTSINSVYEPQQPAPPLPPAVPAEFTFDYETPIKLKGWVVNGFRVFISEGNTQYPEAAVDNGNWQATLNLSEGVHGLTVNAYRDAPSLTDPASYDYKGMGPGIFYDSNTHPFLVKVNPPPAARITSIAGVTVQEQTPGFVFQAGSGTGIVLSGWAPNGHTVSIYEGSTFIADAALSDRNQLTKAWSVTINRPEGTHSIRVMATHDGQSEGAQYKFKDGQARYADGEPLSLRWREMPNVQLDSPGDISVGTGTVVVIASTATATESNGGLISHQLQLRQVPTDGTVPSTTWIPVGDASVVGAPAARSEKSVTYTFDQPGRYEVQATAADGPGTGESAIHTVEVTAGGPRANHPVYWIANRTFTYAADKPNGLVEINRLVEEIWAGPAVLVQEAHTNTQSQPVPPANVVFKSGYTVRLLPGFRAAKGTTFKAQVTATPTEVQPQPIDSHDPGIPGGGGPSPSTNLPPVIAWNSPPTRVKLGQTITATATATDPNGNLQSVSLWRDGQPLPSEAASGSSYTTSEISFTPKAPGNVRFTARAFDDDHASSALAEFVVAVDWSDAAVPPAIAGVSSGLTDPTAGSLVGTLAGAFSVDNKGAANYTIPLPLPPGRAGLQPSLAVSYNNGAGNGPLGIGVSLSTGFPQAITRGRTILARDGVVRGVNFDATDKLYLDGKRLLYIPGSAAEGMPGSTYRTEVDSFVTITAYGTGSNIEGFRVMTKEGAMLCFGKAVKDAAGIMVYGATDGYHVPAGEPLGRAVAWTLKWVEDAVGNYAEFNYNQTNVGGSGQDFTPGPGEHLLTSIRYTGNRKLAVNPYVTIWLRHNNPANTSGIPDNTPRPDKATLYQAGRSVAMTARLDDIAVTTGDTPAVNAPRWFHFKYDGGMANSTLLRLTEVMQSDTGGSMTATRLEWPTGTPALTAIGEQDVQDAPNLLETNPAWTGDFNGDGRHDLLFLPQLAQGQILTSLTIISRAVTGNWDQPVVVPFPNNLSELQLVTTGDFNGDGRTDLVWRKSGKGSAGGGWYVSLATASELGFGAPERIVINTESLTSDKVGAWNSAMAIDLDGDGCDEFLFQTKESYPDINLSWMFAEAFVDSYMETAAPRDGGSASTVPNGKLFVARRPATGSGPWPETEITQQFENINSVPLSLRRIDLDGDGRADLIATEVDVTTGSAGYAVDSNWTVKSYRNTGTTISPTTGAIVPTFALAQTVLTHTGTISASSNAGHVTLTGDINGDGLEDLLNYSDADDGWIVALSKGDGTFDIQPPSSRVPLVVGGANTYFHQPGNVMTAANDDNSGFHIVMFEGLGITGALLLDINGDGRKDFVWYVDNVGWKAVLAGGSGFDTAHPITILAGDSPNFSFTQDRSQGVRELMSEPVALDGIGDGRESMLMLRREIPGQYQWKRVALPRNSSPELFRLAGVTDGLGVKLRLAYEPISKDAIYTSGAGVSYPIREVRRKTVVSDVWKDAGGSLAEGTWAHFSYQYSGARTDLSGRGFLGFHSFVTLDHQTGLFKYQFVAQSFPMTGLTHREETYRWWSEDEKHHFRFISSHDNTVVFDRVAGGNGTLWPFISQAIQYRWEDSQNQHFGFPESMAISQPESLFPQNKPDGAHIVITATSIFDNQGTTPQLTLAGISGFNPSDTAGDGTNAVAGTRNAGAAFAGLPGAITYGNLKELSTDYGDGFTEKVVTTYQDVTANQPFTGLVDTVKTSTTSPGYDTEIAPVKSFTYWTTDDGTPTPLVKTEKVDAGAQNVFGSDGVTNADPKLSLTTTYSRDDRARVINTQISGDETVAATDPLYIGSYSVSSVTEFDDRFDLPTKSRDAEPYQHQTTTAYHAFFGLPTSVTDVNGAQTTTQYDPLGRVKNVTDVLKSLSTDFNYAFDKTKTVNPPVSSNGAPSGDGISLTSAYKVTATSTVKPTVTTYYDRLGRPIHTIKDGFNGQQIHADTVYNVLGQVVAGSLPYVSGQTVYWTKTYHDRLGRVVEVAAPNGTITSSAYHGRITQVTVDARYAFGASEGDEKFQTNSTEVDAKGRMVKVWNADNKPKLDFPSGDDGAATSSTEASIAFDLDGFGRMRTTTLKGQSQTITATYDALGRQRSLNDPDKGPWSYTNNALGQIVSQTDARGTGTESKFDRLGRPLIRTTTEPGFGAPVETARWFYYDAAANSALNLVAQGTQGWIGAPEREESSTTGAPGYAGANSATTTVHYYDVKGRPSIDLVTVDDKWFYTFTNYDGYSRVTNVRHNWRPAGVEDPSQSPYAWQEFEVSNIYDGPNNGNDPASKSYVVAVRDGQGRAWWDNPQYDYADRITSVRKGSGYTTTRAYRPEDGAVMEIKTGTNAGPSALQSLSFNYDGLGNLVSRTGGAIWEGLTYDVLNRLTSSSVQGDISYFDNGNIRRKPNVSGARPAQDYDYDGARPHAVRNAWTYTMYYDANGNLESRTGPNGESWNFRYAGFDKPRWMAKTVGSTTVGSEFLYNANRSRMVHLEFDQMDGSGPTHYVRKRVYGFGGGLEINYKNTATNGAAPTWSMEKVRIYLSGPDGSIGAREFDHPTEGGGTETALVYHHDHLGSIDVVTPFGSTGAPANDAAGNPSRFSEDAWGQRRNPFTWHGPPVATGTGTNKSDAGGPGSVTPRGFTGHEMLDDLGLVHMNGRIYDPLLGRFQSADLMVQFPDSLQSYNRYSYVRNNPLTMTDPAGWWEFTVFGLRFSNENSIGGAIQRAVTSGSADNFTSNINTLRAELSSGSVDNLRSNLQDVGGEINQALKSGSWENVKSNATEYAKTVDRDLREKGVFYTLFADFGAGLPAGSGTAGPALRLAGFGEAVAASDRTYAAANAIAGTAAIVNMADEGVRSGGGDKVSQNPPTSDGKGSVQPGNSAAKGEATAKAEDETVRIRHYTNAKGLKEIKESNVIRASDQDRVFAESAKRKPLSQIEAETTYGLKPGRGRNYVETNVPKDQVFQRYNPSTGADELVIKGDLTLQKPTFTKRP